MRQHLPLARRPRVIFANMANHLMLAAPSEAHGRSLHAVSPRKLWLAHPGDVLVTPVPVADRFARYAAGLLGFDPSEVEMLSPSSPVCEPLAEAVRRAGLGDRLRRSAAEGAVLLPFALDRPTLRLAEELGLPVEGYDEPPDGELVDWVYRLNTKSGFRAAAAALGLPVLPGSVCRGAGELGRAVEEQLAAGHGVIVKLDRSSNGYGHLVLRPGELNGDGLAATLAAARRRVSEQPEDFVVERWTAFRRVPSIEIEVDAAGWRPLYPCDQRCPNGSFSGMVTPWAVEPEVETEMLRAAAVFGAWVHGLGFRGVCDLDAGSTDDGAVFFTESNFRRTGGTYLDTLARRLLGGDYLGTHAWIADARPGRRDLGFAAAVEALADAGLGFDRRRGEGVVLTADSLAVDGRWRYLVLAPQEGDDRLERAERIERRLEQVLELGWA